MRDVLMLFGPSGAGKSTLASEFSAAHGFAHVELDQLNVDAVDAVGLRNEWNAFYGAEDAGPLFATLRQRARALGSAGTVVSLPGLVVPSSSQLHSIREKSGAAVVLYGTAADCIREFLRREAVSGRRLPIEYWLANNSECYLRLSLPEYAPYRLEVFALGAFRPKTVLVGELLQKHVASPI